MANSKMGRTGASRKNCCGLSMDILVYPNLELVMLEKDRSVQIIGCDRLVVVWREKGQAGGRFADSTVLPSALVICKVGDVGPAATDWSSRRTANHGTTFFI